MIERTDLTTDLVRVSLDLSQLRAEVASRNIAHAHVAGYRAERVDFGAALASLQHAVAHPELLPEALDALRGAPVQVTPDASVTVLDAQVNLDQEVAELTVASTQYQALVDSLNRHFGLMQLAVRSRS